MESEQLFEFMTKIYSEMQNGFKRTEEGFKKNDERFDKLEAEIAKTNITIENEINPKINALLDGYKQLAEGQEEIKKEIQALSTKQEHQEQQIRVLKDIAK